MLAFDCHDCSDLAVIELDAMAVLREWIRATLQDDHEVELRSTITLNEVWASAATDSSRPLQTGVVLREEPLAGFQQEGPTCLNLSAALGVA